LIDILEALLFAIAAGFIGSILGLGGALILTPILTYFGVPIQFAIAASMVAIIATSSGAASSYVRDGLSNVRAAFYMEAFTAVGAIFGALATGYIVLLHAQAVLYFLFAGFLATSFLALGKMRNRELPDVRQDRLARWLELEGSYYDKPAQKEVHYNLTRPALAGPGMFFAGVAAGMLGIGGGAFKVSIQEMIMGMPSKVSTATTNFIQGMTALAGASVYFTSGFVYLDLVAPLAIGTTVGSMMGARVLPRLKNKTVRSFFLVVLVLLIVDMVWKGVTSP
jgi:uncharacterized membrane protein YfcA